MEKKKALLIISTKVNKPAIRKAIVQTSLMVQNSSHFEITGYIVVYSAGTADIYKQVRKLRAENRIPFDCILLYNPKAIAKTKVEFQAFCVKMKRECQCEVKWLTME